jgi:hypothetical protein
MISAILDGFVFVAITYLALEELAPLFGLWVEILLEMTVM